MKFRKKRKSLEKVIGKESGIWCWTDGIRTRASPGRGSALVRIA
jgi:hypothetical protein